MQYQRLFRLSTNLTGQIRKNDGLTRMSGFSGCFFKCPENNITHYYKYRGNQSGFSTSSSRFYSMSSQPRVLTGKARHFL